MDLISIVFTLGAVDHIPDRKRRPWYIDRTQHGDDFYLSCRVGVNSGV